MAVKQAAQRKDYLKLAQTRITRPSKSRRLPRLLIYGGKKKGKSTFGGTAPNVLFLDPEHGTDTMLQKDPHVWHIEQWEDVDDSYRFLRLGKHDYKWVNVDGLTRINNMCLRYIMRQAEERDLTRRPGIIDRRDYNKSGELMKQMLTMFHNLPNMGVIYTAQERTITGAYDEDEDGDDSAVQHVPDLPAGVRSHVNSLVDVIGRLYVVRVKVKREGKIVQVKQRRLWVSPDERFDTGYRSDYELPDFTRHPTVPKLVKLIREGTVE